MMRGRGRGDGTFRIKVERVARNQEQDEGGVYEDEVVYVTERPRRRGRPRKPVSVTTRMPPQPFPQRQQQCNEVIYVSAARKRPQYAIPSRNAVQHSLVTTPPRRLTPLLTTPRQLSICAPVCPRPVRCVVAGVSSASQAILNVSKPGTNLGIQRIGGETKIDWPSDLQELVGSWDSLPERRTRDVVKWFQTVSTKSHNQPKIVCEIQEMWSSMAESWGEKVDLALEWLATSRTSQKEPVNQQKSQAQSDGEVETSHIRSKSSKEVPTPRAFSSLNSVGLVPSNRVKVLVEAQPNPIQDCGGQWSSMTDN